MKNQTRGINYEDAVINTFQKNNDIDMKKKKP